MANRQASGKKRGSEVVFVCGEALDVICIANLHQSLQDALQRRKAFVLDVSKAERVDTAALQLLCAFVKTATASGLEFRWHEPSLAVIDAARTLGMHAALFADWPDKRADEGPAEAGGLRLQPDGIG